MVRERGDIIPEHYPVIPCEFAYVADVGSAAGHNGLWHFTIGHVNVIACIGAKKSFGLNAVVLSGNIIHRDARVKWSIGRGLARSHVAIQACIRAGYVNM